MKVGAGVLALVVLGVLVDVPVRARAGADPVLVSGSIVGRGGGELMATAALEPVAATSSGASGTGASGTGASGMVRLHDLPADAVDVVGSAFTVRLDTREVPAGFVSPEGLVTVDLRFVDLADGRVSETVTSALLVDADDQGVWVDPLAAPGEVAAGLASRAAETLPPVPQLRVRMGQGRLPDEVRRSLASAASRGASASEARRLGAAVCGYPPHAPTTDRWATVGTSYPLKRDTATLTYGSSSKTTFGVAVDSGTGWQASGARTLSDSWGQTFKPRRMMRSYRVMVHYKRQTCWDSSGSVVLSRKWVPQFETGGTAEHRLSSRPDWRKCVGVAVGEWWRGKHRGDDYRLSYGVKFKDMIGIDLRTQRAYTSDSRLVYDVKRRRRLCGDTRVPALASKIRERLT